MLYNDLEQVDKYEILDLYITGIDISVLTIDDFSDYIFEQIEKNDSPDAMYCDIALHLSKDWNILRSLIIEYLTYYGYVSHHSDERESVAYHLLIQMIGERYENKIISLKETTQLFYKLSAYCNPYTELAVLEDYYDLAEQRIFKDFTEVEKSVRDILSENKEFLDKKLNRR